MYLWTCDKKNLALLKDRVWWKCLVSVCILYEILLKDFLYNVILVLFHYLCVSMWSVSISWLISRLERKCQRRDKKVTDSHVKISNKDAACNHSRNSHKKLSLNASFFRDKLLFNSVLQGVFLAATNTSRSDDVTLLVCLSVTLCVLAVLSAMCKVQCAQCNVYSAICIVQCA